MNSQSFSLGALTAAQLGAALLLQVIVVHQLGVGSHTDAWVAAQAVPMLVLAIATIGCQGTWQARLVMAEARDGDFRATQQRAQGQLLILVGAAVLILMVTTPIWTRLMFPGFSAEQHALTGEVAILLLFAALLNSHSMLFTMAMRARSKFVLPEVVSLAGSALAILFIVLTLKPLGLMAAAWGTLLRAVSVSTVLFFMSGRARPAVAAAYRDSESWRRMRPLMMSSLVSNSRPIVDRIFGSLAPTGKLTTLNLALLGMQSLASVLERSISTVPLNSLALLAAKRDIAGMRRTYRRCLKIATLVAGGILLTLVAIYPLWPAIAHALIKIEEQDAHEMWWYCVLLVGFLPPASSASAMVHSFYALADTTTPSRIAMIGFAASVVLKAAGFYAFGIFGLVCAIVLYYLGNLAFMVWLLERCLRRAESIP